MLTLFQLGAGEDRRKMAGRIVNLTRRLVLRIASVAHIAHKTMPPSQFLPNNVTVPNVPNKFEGPKQCSRQMTKKTIYTTKKN